MNQFCTKSWFSGSDLCRQLGQISPRVNTDQINIYLQIGERINGNLVKQFGTKYSFFGSDFHRQLGIRSLPNVESM